VLASQNCTNPNKEKDTFKTHPAEKYLPALSLTLHYTQEEMAKIKKPLG
jgi:hypothetical protein